MPNGMLALPLSLPLLTLPVAEQLIVAQDRAEARITVSLDLGRTTSTVEPRGDHWISALGHFPYPFGLQDQTIYGWTGESFEPVLYPDESAGALVPTEWGPPVMAFEGVAMLPEVSISPYEYAQRKLARINVRGKRVLECSGGLGYLAHWCLVEQAAAVVSIEQSSAAAWLREINPWSPRHERRLSLVVGDLEAELSCVAGESFDVVLVEVPLAAPAASLRPQKFYNQLARAIVPDGLLMHSLPVGGDANQASDLAQEVLLRLKSAGFVARMERNVVVAQRRLRMVMDALPVRSRLAS